MALWTVLPFLVAYLALCYVLDFIKDRRFRKFAATHGAEEPPKAPPNKLPWGIYGVYRIMNANRRGEDIFDDIIMPRFQVVGFDTFVGPGLLGEQVLSTIDSRNIQAILATNFKDWAIGQRRIAQFGPFLGNGIFTSDGAEWSHHRGLARPQFTRENINDLDGTEMACQDLIRVIELDASDQWTKAVDLLPLLYRFTLDAVTKFFFGQSVKSQLAAAGIHKAGTDGDATTQAMNVEFDRAWTDCQNWIGQRIRMQGLYWLMNGTKPRKPVKTVRNFASHYAKLAIETRSRPEFGQEKKRFSLLEAMAADTTDPIELRDMILALLLAGRDTTANLLSWTFLLLSQNPSIFYKLRTVILSDFGTGMEKLDFENLKSCRYLQYVMYEVLRLYPVTPINNRVAVRDTVLPSGGGPDGTKPVAVRKGQLCNFFIYGIHRRPDVWGPDAAEFKPERWEGRKMDWNYIPFSGGPRVCLGECL